MKHTLAALTCGAALVVSLTACGSGDEKSTLPLYTGGSHPSTTATSQPTTAPTATDSPPDPLAAHSTHTYGGLKVIVNLPTHLSSASRPSMLLFSDFLQGVGRTTARNKLDPSLSGFASADVVKYVGTFVEGASVQGIGSVIFTISGVHTTPHGPTFITGCVDQSRLVQVRKDGSHYVDPGMKKVATLKMSADINRRQAGPEVTAFTFALGSC